VTGLGAIFLEGETLGHPNGLAWDSRNDQLIVGGFGAPAVMTWKPGGAAPTQLALGPGQYDGVEVLADGRILVSSWADSSVHVISNGLMRKAITGVEAPADIGYDTRRSLLLVPRFNGNTVELWRLR
jgi:hypothetical protein